MCIRASWAAGERVSGRSDGEVWAWSRHERALRRGELCLCQSSEAGWQREPVCVITVSFNTYTVCWNRRWKRIVNRAGWSQKIKKALKPIKHLITFKCTPSSPVSLTKKYRKKKKPTIFNFWSSKEKDTFWKTHNTSAVWYICYTTFSPLKYIGQRLSQSSAVILPNLSFACSHAGANPCPAASVQQLTNLSRGQQTSCHCKAPSGEVQTDSLLRS